MADDNLFQIELVTPERILLTGSTSEVILRTGEGDVTFLAGHTPLVGTVEPGVARVALPEGDVVKVAVHGGFVQVEQGVPAEADAAGAGEGPGTSGAPGTRVTLLAGVAELAEEIDTERARVAFERAESRVAELGAAGSRAGGEAEEPDAEMVDAEAALRRAQVRLEATATATAGVTATAAT
ncbi:MAG TPA: ATP synthase delta/epsilon chain alpha-helix domain-containing protein [Acidimicrobiales bacterium]|nr:ATP synthase delta/epsilon chain alpha-helix domain-containing protein [Acidimicrobiales bacterium]